MATVDKIVDKPTEDVVTAVAGVEQEQKTLMRDVFMLIAEPLGTVEETLQRELHSDAPFVDDLLVYVSELGGKRMRPCLILLTGLAAGKLSPHHATLAAVLEMIHTATLVHDDILDSADKRRHQASVNHRWGNQAAVLLGDYLFTHAFYLASTVDVDACQIIGKSTNVVCSGEMRQVGQRGNLALTEEEYFEIIRDKTAELCACCCELGARYSGATSEVVDQMRQFGMELGTAFQIADDVLDLLGDEEDTGKSIGTDLANQKMTLPMIHVLSKLADADRERLTRCIIDQSADEETRERLGNALAEHGSVEYARQKACALVDSAVSRLDCLDDSLAKDALSRMATLVIHRKT